MLFTGIVARDFFRAQQQPRELIVAVQLLCNVSRKKSYSGPLALEKIESVIIDYFFNFRRNHSCIITALPGGLFGFSARYRTAKLQILTLKQTIVFTYNTQQLLR